MPTKTTLKNLGSRLKRRIDSIESATNRTKKAIAKAILNDLVDRSPADTSRLVSNWLIYVNLRGNGNVPVLTANPYYGKRFIQAHVPGSKGNTKAASAAITLSKGYAKIATATKNQSIHISNNTPYLVYLNTFNHGGHGGFADVNLQVITSRIAGKFKVKYAQ